MTENIESLLAGSLERSDELVHRVVPGMTPYVYAAHSYEENARLHKALGLPIPSDGFKRFGGLE